MKQLVANIIPATNLAGVREQIFSYTVPEGITVAKGMIVKIPFGSRMICGAVVSTDQVDTEQMTLKPIISVLSEEPLFTPELYELAQFISRQYLCSLALAVKMLLPKIAPRVRVLKNDLMPQTTAGQNAITLNADQSLAAKSIASSFGRASTFLLFGVTGSGKTEVYMTAAEKALRAGKQILLLVPEIALTPQTLNRLIFRFPRELVAVSHSKISYGQKYLIWKKIYSGEIKILIGPRSALFAPFRNLGLIAIDEEHDSSYKQSDQNPKFHSRTVAEKLSQLWNCPLILGDATPSVETYYRAEQ
ncbi:MAG: DEAD/DEAH box helicase family protein, partial [bacterium]|nr:DEAD/DEAH box helicase family protein [bacterium]